MASSPRTRASCRAGFSASERRRWSLLSLHQSAHFDAQFFLTPTVGPDDQAPCSIVRHRLVDHVWMEEVTVTNHLHETAAFRVVLEVDADFADLFEVKDGVVAEREITFTHDRQSLTLAYERRCVSPLGHDRGELTGDDHPRSASSTSWSSRLASSGRPASRSPPVPFSRRPGLRDANRAVGSKTCACEEPPNSRRGWPVHRPSKPTTRRCYAPIARASVTSPRSGCTRTSRLAQRCRQRGCRGSWRCSAATA